MVNILVVDDEKEIADIIAAYLENEKFKVFKCYDGKSAYDIIKKKDLDLAILDVMLPDADGFEILQKIRKGYTFPVIMLTAKTEFSDRVNGLTLGADDYIPKPFNPLELVARVKAQLRRFNQYNNVADEDTIMAEGLEINNETRIAKYDGAKITLTPTEFDILYMLCEKKGEVVSADDIYKKLSGSKEEMKNNAIMVHIRHLREKMSKATGRDDFIKTVWGVGYKIDG